jgi:hypothetical protein
VEVFAVHDSSDSLSGAAAAGIFGMFTIIAIVCLALTVFFVWMFWRIFARTGMNGALGLLCLIPSIGPLICLLLLAFSRWPIEDGLAPQEYAAAPAPPPNFPPPARPGTSVMPS